MRKVWRHLYDVRPGEGGRVLFMFLYLLCVLFAYYILKSASRAMFLNKFDIDKLPILIVLIAIGGGFLAYLYSKVAVKFSLKTAVTGAMFLSVACLVVMWWVLHAYKFAWMLYVLNIWVSLFSVVTVAQGWLVASNVFNTREAKRLYGLLGLGAVIGAAFGGEFTARTALLIGSNNLLLASAVMCVLAYLSFYMTTVQPGVSLASAKGGEAEEVEFTFNYIASAIHRNRHLQIIIAIMVMMFIVDVLVDYQFQAMAKATYKGDHLTVFYGRFNGLYLNAATFTFQFFLTSWVVSRFGVGGTLQIMPVSISLASLATILAPTLTSTAAVRLTEAATRYTLNRTGMELLYLPLPLDLRNRTKAFVDIFVDRMSRGVGGAILIVVTADWLDLGPRQIAMMVMGLALGWILLSHRASREYIGTIRQRLAARRLDLDAARLTVQDQATVRLLEQTAAGDNPRQAAYALSLLADTPHYHLRSVLQSASQSPHAEVRARAFELARGASAPELLPTALAELRRRGAVREAVSYLIAVSPDGMALAREFLDDPIAEVAEAAIEAMVANPELARQLLNRDWILRTAGDPSPIRRPLAALAIGIAGDGGIDALHKLLEDEDPRVVRAALRAAGRLRNRAYLHGVIRRLANSECRGVAIDALAEYGPAICGTLSDLLEDRTVPVRLRRQVPRVLKMIRDQRSVDVLLKAVANQDIAIQGPVLKALNSLRETAPELRFDDAFIRQQILNEARYYFELAAAIEPLRNREARPRSAVELLVRTLEERLQQSLERLFRLLGLKYPPKEIYFAYLAVHRRRSEELTAAIEFLDNVLERELKRILLPLLDAPEHLPQRGRELFGVEVPTAVDALRDLIRSEDPWLAACAMAAAAELKIREVVPDIAEIAQKAEPELHEVATSAQEALT